VASGLRCKENVRAATTASTPALSGQLAKDGVALVAGDRVLVRAQALGASICVYVAAAGAWARSADIAAGLSAATAAFFVAEGAAYANKSFVYANVAGSDPIGTAALEFVVDAASAGGDVSGPASRRGQLGRTLRRDHGHDHPGQRNHHQRLRGHRRRQAAGAERRGRQGHVRSLGRDLQPHLTLPVDRGATGTSLQSLDGTGALARSAAGNVTGAASSTDNAVARRPGHR
jgi:hypothetical protein